MGRTIKPLKNKLIVRQDPKKETVNGLYLPDNAKKLYDDLGVVEAVGSEITQVKVGDRVMFARRANSALFERAGDDFENLLVLTEDDIVAVVTE